MSDDRPRPRSSGPYEPGMVVGAYQLVRRLDRGGMAEVWIAKNAGTGRAEKHVALKFIAQHLADDKRYRRLFRAEAEVAMMLNHANIVQVFGFDEQHEVPYLVMEWVDGINLRKVRDSLAAVSEDRRIRIACYVAEQLLHALRYAHSIVTHQGQEVGLVHRDVTPQNVLVSNSAEVKLTDFGVAATSFDETSGLHVKGKIRYMAPEQLSGKSRAKTVDLYAAGAIFHELLEGERFRGQVEDDRELYSEVVGGVIPETSCELPDAIEALRCGLLEPDPGQRIQTADEALDLLCMIPRHGDPRRELMQLCAGLTGIVVPRSGPGASTMHAIARPKRGARHARARSPGGSAPVEVPAPRVELAPEPLGPVAVVQPPVTGVSSVMVPSRTPTAPSPVIPPSPPVHTWFPVDSTISAPIEIDATRGENGDSGATPASHATRAAAKRPPGSMALFVVAGLVLIATTATVTWRLANPGVEPTRLAPEVKPEPKAFEGRLADPEPLPSPGTRGQDPTGGDGTIGGEGGTSSGEGSSSGEGETSSGGDTSGGVLSTPPPVSQPPVPPPEPPKMTIRVGRTVIGPLWVWTSASSVPVRIESPPYREIRGVAEGSYVYWNTVKTKKGAWKQKVGKRKKGKLWSLVIKPTTTEAFYIEQ